MKSIPRFALLLLFFPGLVHLRVAAQDVTVGDPVWFLTDPPPTELPKPKNRLRPDYPDEMRQSSEVGYVTMAVFLDPSGKRLSINALGTHVALQRAVEAAMPEWALRPAVRDGQPINSRVWVPVIFNPKSAGLKGADATPRLLSVTPVVTPARPTPGNLPPTVRMKLSLDATGAITQATPEETVQPEILDAITAGLKNWRFAPARQNGQPVAAELIVPVICQGATKANASRNVPPKAITRKMPDYPFAMRRFGLRGTVTLEFEVDPKGKVENVFVVSSDNPAFDESAIKAVREWKFEPATHDGQPVKEKMRVPVVFQLNGALGGGEIPFQLSQRGDQSKLPPEMRFDTMPKFRGVVVPVYPYELRRDRVRGKARVAALINQQGRVVVVQVVDTDRPEFGLALTTALEGFSFDPALKDGHPVQHLLGFEQVFNSDELPDEAADDLLSLEKKHPERILPIGSLDVPLKPVSQRAPAFPKGLLGKVERGEALIEILVDDEGRVRLPRIVSASEPAFGYSAVQAVSSWWFEPPKAGGKTVVARAQIPFRFEPKTPAPAQPVSAGGSSAKPNPN